MSQTFFIIPTAAGEAKIARAQALGLPLKFTHMAVGDGGGALPVPNRERSELVNEQHRAPLNTLKVDPTNSSQYIAEQVIPDSVGGWWIRELGLYDEDGTLCYYGNCPETYKPQLAEGSGRTQVMRMVVLVSSGVCVEIRVDPSIVLATRQYVDDEILVIEKALLDASQGDSLVAVQQPYEGAVPRTQHDKNTERVTFFDFMNVFERADALSPAPKLDHTRAIDSALEAMALGAKRIGANAGRFNYSGTGFEVLQGCILEGEGIDYWDTFRPDPINLMKSDQAGTTIYFCGTGPKVHTLQNITNYREPKTLNDRTFSFTEFTLNDSANGSPATPKPFSAAVIINKNSQLRNIRLVVNCDQLAGYNDPSRLALGDDWDIGVWARGANDCVVHNVQAVGYWRMGAWLLTENDGTFSEVGNAERCSFTKCMGQGRRGLLIRNAPQVPVVSNTDHTVTVKYNPSCRFTAVDSFRITETKQTYTYSGYEVIGDDLRLTGVTPALPAAVSVLRAPNQGCGFSASVFNDCLFATLDHASRMPSSFFGIGEAAAVEADGFPIRAVSFNNTKWQTTRDAGLCLLGDIRDWKLTSTCQWENGAAIAYHNSEGVGYTENFRMEGEIGASVDLTHFNPRSAWLPYLQIPTQLTDGSYVSRPWREASVRLESAGGIHLYEYRLADRSVRMRNANNFEFVHSNGATDETVFAGNNISFKNSVGTPLLSMFNTSLNASFAANVTAGNDLVSTNNTRPASDNTKSCGTPAQRYSVMHAGTAAISTSDERQKSFIEEIDDAALDAWEQVHFQQFKFLDAVARKGEDGARWHFGVIAQRVKDAFEEAGLDPFAFGLLCYDEWPEQYETIAVTEAIEVVDKDGETRIENRSREIETLVKPAGNAYGIRYELALCLEAAVQRRRCARLEHRVVQLETRAGLQ
ncbi:phage tail-collar fiber domain-containing protein [Cupriavidus oxalaticus]|uniref:Phage tail protein n=1 Tax=Cupriavidus oxalaticus TaxID=96344 RepID=A0A375G4X8_9BURK|nr:phage tail protein [Cupriavidus oxalaticus]QRQ88506.1 phage tail protein [Cupriavidus oxalaticus]QRQ93168.1 phage tail protein [Cupriavidus oxalaticus]WQD81778.1 phage tail protein [Cupriavidus oxalaticus]SPC13148.1 conserved hypothetical protein [Cupriavidus oxalaticus]